ncbi:MAG TPA: hypothetical protein PK385_01900 [Spirochaetota bacterium]|nr:hypothetical protein [Spirochaetota bacterium]HOS31604.1 hypothetical protein [Spirochaetota bacterium]HOS54791.1 hypothetical protein [Spirochaetota bacterium]HPK61415.1 hypothetical protein [Spirochaetota bacterium]HQF77407.1 hypothetical protein [Spirochaetota bacterium]
MDGNIFSQEEINNLNIDENISLEQDIRNIIILAKNELNIIENKIDGYNQKNKEKIKKRLNQLLTKIISIRQ